MALNLTRMGTQMSSLTGVRAIMKDIIETLRTGQGKTFYNFSAGNPVILPEIEQLWRDCTQALLDSDDYGSVVGRYGASQGYEPLIEAIKDDFNQRYGLQLSDRQILITPGSQSLYFLAANVFGGYNLEQQLKKIVLPLSPDYTGYGGVSLEPEALIAYKPADPKNGADPSQHSFKYRPDFHQLHLDDSVGCVIFSRPCNPTGNVLTDAEVAQITEMAAPHGIPVLIDSAYGSPYPHLNFTPMTPFIGNNVVHCLSLSKAGLPGERVGIAIGDEQIIQVLEAFQTNMCIHSGRYGQAIAAQAIRSGQLAHLSETVIKPFYQRKFAILATVLRNEMPKDVEWYLHQGEGAIFGWLWLPNLPISDWELYQQLKQVGVIVVPGSTFFPGLREEWRHKQECIRISLTAEDEMLKIGLARLAATLHQIYQDNPVPTMVTV
jgi:valine--pyruvate aminotransferase